MTTATVDRIAAAHALCRAEEVRGEALAAFPDEAAVLAAALDRAVRENCSAHPTDESFARLTTAREAYEAGVAALVARYTATAPRGSDTPRY